MSARRTPAARTLASGSRVDLLDLLQRGGPQTVGELATLTGLHQNTTREHLQRLVSDGYVLREPEIRTVRGRPRMIYRVAQAEDVRTDPVAAVRLEESIARAALTRVLLDGYGKQLDSPRRSAEEAGRSLALRHARRKPGQCRPGCPDAEHDTGSLSPDELVQRQVDAVDAHLDRLGFDPTLDLEQNSMDFHLWRCPFLDLARERSEVVCSVHLGLVRGVLEATGGPVVATDLQPFVGPHHCVLRLRRENAATTEAAELQDAVGASA
ncbi:helix-turn-helix transcriptional regulator [Cellulomonas soli]|uniref:helix-turn-helix transcriptional regulator n=1 Tax=Cellulomonas soli TaxID=931535 RepID=UPI003F87847C